MVLKGSPSMYSWATKGFGASASNAYILGTGILGQHAEIMDMQASRSVLDRVVEHLLSGGAKQKTLIFKLWSRPIRRAIMGRN